MYKEILCYTKDILLGSILNEDIYNHQGVLLCSKDSIMDKNNKEKLRKYTNKVKIRVPLEDGQNINLTKEEIEKLAKEIDSEEDKSFKLNDTLKKYTLTCVENIYDNLENPQEMVNTTKEIGEKLCSHIYDSGDLEINLVNLKVCDEYTYKHSISVGTIAALIAIELKKSKSFIDDILIAGILHDVGKVEIPLEILNKPGKLTDEEFTVIKTHPVHSYNLLIDNTNLKESIKQAILNHHENVDGTGYPRSLSQEKIGDMAKILTIADVFDALVSERPYKPAKTAGQSLEIMYSMGYKFDLKFFGAFLNIVNAYPNGSIVRLNNGELYKVVSQNKKFPLRPNVENLITKERINLSLDKNYLCYKITAENVNCSIAS